MRMDLPSGGGGAVPAAHAPDARAAMVWRLFDLALLAGALIASLDMLIHARPVQSLVWLFCYGGTLLRIAMNLGAFLPTLLRNWPILVYPSLCVASVLWTSTPSYSLVAALQLSMTMLIAMYLGWRYALAPLIKVAAVVMGIGVLLSLLHWATGIFPWPVYTRAGGLAGLFSHKNMLGLRALFCLTAVLALVLMRRSEIGPMLRLWAAGMVVVSLFAVVLSQAMTAVALVPMMVGIVLLLCLHRLPTSVGFAMVVATLLGVGLAPLGFALIGTNPIDAGLGALGKSSTLTGRTVIWAVAWDVHVDNPWLGVGYRAFWRAPEFLNARLMTSDAGATTSSSFHNFVLEILVSVGWLGVIAILSIVAIAVRRLGRLFVLTRAPAAAGALALVFGIVVSSLLGPTLYRGHDSMMILLVAFAVSAGEDLRRMRRA